MQEYNEKAVVLDVDGVLFDFDSGFAEMASFLYDRKISRLSNRYDLSKRFGLTEKEFKTTWQAMMNGGFASLPALPGAIESFEKLKSWGYSIHLVTGIPDEIKDMRLDNFRMHGIFPDTIDCVGSGTSKKDDKIAQYKPVLYADDRLIHLLDAHFVPHRVFIDRKDEQEHTCTKHVDYTVDELCDFILHKMPLLPDFSSNIKCAGSVEISQPKMLKI